MENEMEATIGRRDIVPLKSIEYGFGYMIITSPYPLCSIYLSGTIISGELGHGT